MDILFRDKVIALIDVMIAGRGAINGASIVQTIEMNGFFFGRVDMTPAQTIEANTIIVQPMSVKIEDTVLETFDGAGDLVENVGPPVVIGPYKPPKDKRVQHLVKAAQEREKPASKPREIFSDPRLDPSYRQPKPKK